MKSPIIFSLLFLILLLLSVETSQSNNEENNQKIRTLKSYLKNQQYFKALEYQYKNFFHQPFSHQKLIQNTFQPEINELLNKKLQQMQNHLDKAIIKTYIQSYQDALKELQAYFKEQSKLKQALQENIYAIFLHLRLLDKLQQYTNGFQITKKYLSQIQSKQIKPHFYLYHMLGNFQMHHLKYQQAIQSFKKSIKQQPYQQQFPFTYYNIGLCLQKLNKHKQSLTYFKHIYKISKERNDLSAQIANVLGYCYYNLGKLAHNKNSDTHQIPQHQDKIRIYWDKAELYFKESISINNKYFVAYFNIATLKLDQNYKIEAAQYYQKVLQIDPTVKSAVYGLFKSKYQEKQKQKHLKIFDRIKKKTPQILLDMGIILYQSGLNKEALQRINQGLKVVEHKDLLEWKGTISYHIGKNQDAEKAYKRSIQLGNKKAALYYNLGLVQKHLKKYQLALDSFKSAENLQPRQQTKKEIQETQKILKGQQL